VKRIEITIMPDGQSTVEAFGFASDSCRQATEAIERSLGASSSERLKPEFHQTYQTSEQQTRQG